MPDRRTASSFVPIAMQYRPNTVRRRTNWLPTTTVTANKKAGENEIGEIGLLIGSITEPIYFVSELVISLVRPLAISSMLRVTMKDGILAFTEIKPFAAPHNEPTKTAAMIARSTG